MMSMVIMLYVCITYKDIAAWWVGCGWLGSRKKNSAPYLCLPARSAGRFEGVVACNQQLPGHLATWRQVMWRVASLRMRSFNPSTYFTLMQKIHLQPHSMVPHHLCFGTEVVRGVQI